MLRTTAPWYRPRCASAPLRPPAFARGCDKPRNVRAFIHSRTMSARVPAMYGAVRCAAPGCRTPPQWLRIATTDQPSPTMPQARRVLPAPYPSCTFRARLCRSLRRSPGRSRFVRRSVVCHRSSSFTVPPQSVGGPSICFRSTTCTCKPVLLHRSPLNWSFVRGRSSRGCSTAGHAGSSAAGRGGSPIPSSR